MAVPGFQMFLKPILVSLADGMAHSYRKVAMDAAHALSLTPEDRQTLLPSGKQQTYVNRTAWAVTYLHKAGLVDRPDRGMVQITETGLSFLARSPETLSMSDLMAFESFRQFRFQTKDSKVGHPSQTHSETSHPDDGEELPPDEQIDFLAAQMKASLRDDLIRMVESLTPTQFETFVVRLLKAMGYGKAAGARAEAIGGTGDGGVDGVISEDLLGLDEMYIQAKHYKRDNKVTSQAVVNFVGALDIKQATKGVFITTSSFTAAAYQQAERSSKRVILIDGERLADLMLEHHVGVKVARKIPIQSLDEDFFENLPL